MGFYGEQILPRVTHLVCANKAMQKVRRPALEGLSGTVVEIGFGSGPNVGLYPSGVDKVYAVEPSQVARTMASERVAASEVDVEFIGLTGEQLPLPDASVDSVLSTFTLCTIPDVDQALREARRVLKPGGRLFFLEHGLAESPKVQKWQHRLDPIQQRVAGGCHLARRIDDLVADAGFDIDRLARFTIAGPKTHSSMYCGVALAPSEVDDE
jgi:ubiquinone/menaquinone biosynthesis C-methylase UbiE